MTSTHSHMVQVRATAQDCSRSRRVCGVMVFCRLNGECQCTVCCSNKFAQSITGLYQQKPYNRGLSSSIIEWSYPLGSLKCDPMRVQSLCWFVCCSDGFCAAYAVIRDRFGLQTLRQDSATVRAATEPHIRRAGGLIAVTLFAALSCT